jgi:Winged helix-turn helix
MREGIDIEVSAADREQLAAVVADRNSRQKHVWRARIILATGEGCGTAEIMRRAGVSKPCVWRWQERFMHEGVAGLLHDKTRKPGLPPLPSALVDDVVALTLAEPPGETTGAILIVGVAQRAARTKRVASLASHPVPPSRETLPPSPREQREPGESRGDAGDAYAASDRRHWNTWPSLHMACSTTASLRASATRARRIPRRWARRTAQTLSGHHSAASRRNMRLAAT